MINEHESGVLLSADVWKGLAREIGGPGPGNRFLKGLLAAFREAGAVYYVTEGAYLDRDYVKAYSSLHHRLYKPHPKHCRRVHFFGKDLSEIEGLEPEQLAAKIEAERDSYLGFAVIRPIANTPISWAVVSAAAAGLGADVLVRSDHEVHLLGARLRVTGSPITEQDGRTGSCAQAIIWGIARHLHATRRQPWRSVVEITDAALAIPDLHAASNIPHGSGQLSRDAMVRAMTNLGMHPLVYQRGPDDSWPEPPHRTIARYLDSGMPVVVGMRHGHAVLAVGLDGSDARPTRPPEGSRRRGGARNRPPILGPSVHDYRTHLLINDDQAGPYGRLPLQRPLNKPFASAEDATFLMVSMPDGVVMRAETAEAVARDQIARLVAQRSEVLEIAFDGVANAPDLDFSFDAVGAGAVARTYLTAGWKYASRMLRNDAPAELKSELMRISLPKFVWVTEFSLPADPGPLDPCRRTVLAHVVVDSTAQSGENDWESVIVTHLPGMLYTASYDPGVVGRESEITIHALTSDGPYRPKARGRADYSDCPADGPGTPAGS